MRNILSFFASLAAVLALVSCQKEGPATSFVGDRVDCVFSVSGTEGSSTRSVGLESDAAGTVAEKAVRSLQVFVFDSTEICVASRRVTNTGSLTMTLEAASSYDFYAVANMEDLEGEVSSVEDLLALTTDVLGTEEGASRFPMRGSLLGQPVNTASHSFSIEVERRAAKVVLRQIVNSLPPEYGDIIVEGIYLSNVATVSNLFEDSMPEDPVWMNRMGGYDTLSPFAWLGDKLSVAVAVGQGGSYDIPHTFYAAANDVEEDSREDDWCPRFSRLVVRTNIQGITRYYPLSFGEELPALGPNEYIDITTLNIKNLGPIDPEKPITTAEVSVTVTVREWNRTGTEVEF